MFDDEFMKKVEKVVKNHDFNSHNFKIKDIFNLRELNKAIKSLKTRSAAGEDSVNNRMLQNTTVEFKLIIIRLINQTVKQSKLPKKMKESIITMIPKKQSNSSDTKDSRPISLTNCLCKLAERLILGKMKKFLEKNNILVKQQPGFRSKRQTRDNIFFLTQKALESMNRGKKLCSIFFDIASAFDKVWHNGLICKLIKLKLPNHLVSWIFDFLMNRFFSVIVGDFTTEKLPIKAGVPQGAVLSPTLFSLFINDIPIKYKKNKFYSLLFADDLCALKTFKKCGNVNKEIQSYLNLIEKWLKKWRLMMAPHKCSFIIFSNDKTISGDNNINILTSYLESK